MKIAKLKLLQLVHCVIFIYVMLTFNHTIIRNIIDVGLHNMNLIVWCYMLNRLYSCTNLELRYILCGR